MHVQCSSFVGCTLRTVEGFTPYPLIKVFWQILNKEGSPNLYLPIQIGLNIFANWLRYRKS